MNISQLTTETISVPNISANDNLKLINPINTVSIMNDSKYNCSVESKTNKPFLIRDSKCLWDINDKTYSSVINDRTLILQELEEQEMVSMAIADSMLTLHLEEQLRLKEQEEKELNTDECDLPSLETKSNISEVSKENICDNNNNDDNVNKISKSDLEQNTEQKTDVEITEVQCDATKNEDSNKGDQSNIIDLNKEADTLLNLSNSNTISELNDNTSVCTPSATSNSNDESKKVQEEITNTYERKEESKTVIKKDTVASTPNTNNDVTLKQNTENKMTCGLKHSINTSTETARRTLDKRDKPRQTVASLSKKESMIGNPSSELTVRHDMKHLKRNEHGKTTFTNSVNKQYRVNHACHMYKKENGSVSKMHPLKPELNTVKEITNCSNSFNSMQSMKKPSFNTTTKYSIHKKMSGASNADNKYKNTEKNAVYLVPLVSKEREKKFNVKSKLDKEVKESNKSGITKFPNEHSINNNVEQRQTNTNPFLPNSSYLPVSNEMQTDAKNVKDTVYSDLPSKNKQLENIPCTNISYGYPVSQHNTKQELIPSHQNFTHCTPDLFFMNYSLNNTSPKFYSNANTIPLSRYGNVQTMSSNSSGVKLPNCSNPNAIPSNTGNTNGFQYQMPNVLSYSNQNIRPNYCVHPMMSPEEQFNTHMYGYNPAYFVNPVCACRNDCYPSHSQNWKIPTNQPVPLMQGPYYYNCNSFYNENVQSHNTMHKNTAFAARPIQSHAHVHIPYEQNLQRKSPYTFEYDVRSSQNDKCNYNLKAQGNMTNNSKNIDFKNEQQDYEFSNENEVNNLPMVSPKACMFYGSKVSTNINTVKSQVKYSNTSERLSTNTSIDSGKAKLTSEIQPNYKTQY